MELSYCFWVLKKRQRGPLHTLLLIAGQLASLPDFSAVRIHPPPLSPPLALARRILLPKPSTSRCRSLLHSPSLGASSSPSLARAPAPRGQPHPPAHLLRDGSCSNFISSSSATVPASFLILHVSNLLLFFSLPLTLMLLLSIHPFGRFFFLQTYVLWLLRRSGRCLCA